MLAPETAVLVVPGCDHHIGLRDLFPPAFVNLQMAQAVSLAFWSQWSRFIPCDACGPKCFWIPSISMKLVLKIDVFELPRTFIDNPKTSIFKTSLMLIDGIPKHFGPQSITSPVGKSQSTTPDNATVLPRWSLQVSSSPAWSYQCTSLWSRQRRCTVYIRSSKFGWSKNVTEKFSNRQGGGSRQNKTQRTENSCSPDLRLVVGFFFNKSLASGQLPDEFKSGLLLPIFKSGKTDSQKAENYRGISLTCILSKVIERIVHSQFCDHFQSSGTFSDSRYGFRRNHSCSDLLVSTIDDWLLARDIKLNTTIVYFGPKKGIRQRSSSKSPALSTECRHWRYSSEMDTPLSHWQTLSTNRPRPVHTQGTAIYASCSTKVSPRGAY